MILIVVSLSDPIWCIFIDVHKVGAVSKIGIVSDAKCRLCIALAVVA